MEQFENRIIQIIQQSELNKSTFYIMTSMVKGG